MSDTRRGFGEQLFARLQERGLSRAQIYKALALQRLTDEVMELGQQGKLSEGALVELSKINCGARQKQLAELAIRYQLSNVWVKELGRLIRNAEKTSSDIEANKYWDFFFEIKDALDREPPTDALLTRIKNFAIATADVADVSDRTVVDFKKFDLESGRGLDVGTSNIVAAIRTTDGRMVYNIQRNAFIDLRNDTFVRKMLMKLGVDHIVRGEKGYVVGDHAFELANIFEKNTRRPMKDGMISPSEPEALLIVSLIIEQLLGPPKTLGEICSYSVPAEPIDCDRNVVYHRGAIESVLRKMGYEPKAMLEGHCVVMGEMEADDFTGIGISCGAGMFNVCIAYKSVPALAFSTSRGGDWIDNYVAQALGMPASQVCAVKESGVNLSRARDRVEEAIVIYYRELIRHSLETIRNRFESAQNMPTFPSAVPVVCAGGTAMVKGFIDVFREEFARISFPIDVKEIRLANDPLRTVARGCVIDAGVETTARAKAGTETSRIIHLSQASVSKVTTLNKDTRRFLVEASAKKNEEETRRTVLRPAPPPAEPVVAKEATALEPPPQKPEDVAAPPPPPLQVEDGMEIAVFGTETEVRRVSKPSPPKKEEKDSKDFPLIS